MSETKIPDVMTVAVLHAYKGVQSLSVEQRPVPRPGNNEVLVKVAFSPINPSDLATLDGHYGFKDPTPIVPGGEGSGEVIAAGPGFMARYFLGKKVACTGWSKGGGVWSEYVVKAVKGGVLKLNKNLSLEQGAMSMVNPLTAFAFIDIAKKGGHKAISLTAAASSLGLMVNSLARKEGIEVVNVVRRDIQLELLKAQGANIVLNSADEEFEDQLKNICHQKDVHLAFDAVAGQISGQLLKAMPSNSKVTVYSALSMQAVETNPGSMIFENKSIDGFWLGPWLRKQGVLRTMRIWNKTQRQIKDHLKSKVRKTYPLKEVKEAIADYRSQMTGGKILLSMSN